MAWVPVLAYGARVVGGTELAEPGGQRVVMLGGMAVAEWGAAAGGGAATAAAPIRRPDIVAYMYFMSIHHIGSAGLIFSLHE
jgi:hypothetical protein